MVTTTGLQKSTSGLAVKCVKQSCSVEPLLSLMETFRQMVNDCIRIGLQHNVSTMKRLSKFCYQELGRYNIISYYKLHAISKAAGILKNRKQSINRGYQTKTPIIQLSTSETRGTSQLCPQCGKRLQVADYKDVIHNRQFFCKHCNRWMDRDVVAAMNIARKGAEVFQRSKGFAGEAVKGNPTMPVILRVNASKLTFRHEP